MWPGLLLLAVCAGSSPVRAETLRYEAFVAGARAGHAVVEVNLVEDRYEVTGTAAAGGVVEVFSSWRTRFQAHGQLVGEAPEPAEYSYVEHDADQLREITVRGGMLSYFKNGRKRREGQSPAGLDVLSALFVRPSCEAQRQVHTGRSAYRLTRLPSLRDGECRYQVIDDDDDQYQADIRFDRRGELTVPVAITLRGFLTGKVVLVDQ